jgi:hypothetical protein
VFLSEIRGTWQSTEELRHLRRISFLLDDRQGFQLRFRRLRDLFWIFELSRPESSQLLSLPASFESYRR